MWKVIFVECRPVATHWWSTEKGSIGTLTQLPRNAGAFFPKHLPEDAGGKHDKVKKRRRQDILRFRADACKLILGSKKSVL